MFAVIGQKINDRLKGNTNFVNANGKTLGSELISNNTWNDTTGWAKYPAASPIALSVENNNLKTLTGGFNTKANAYTTISVQQDKTYFCEYSYNSSYQTSVNVGTSELGSEIYEGELKSAGTGTVSFTFTATSTATYYVSFTNHSTVANSFGLLTAISVKEITSAKVFPVIIPQGTTYPATTYEIANVSNFMSKGSSLESCDVSVNISCFADAYGTTYNQAKAVVEALDLYQVTYTEDGQSYIAKFRFMNLDDEYFKTPEKFYKNLTFNCLIIKN
jgi:hypothetical protein